MARATKTEQSDLDQALYGRNGEAPLVNAFCEMIAINSKIGCC